MSQTPVSQTHADLQGLSAREVRAAIRSGAYAGHTAGLAPGALQANLAILPADAALDFFRFCQRNPKPCPIVGVSDTGDPILRTLGEIDIRTDLPSYNVYRDGRLAETVTQIGDLWQDDFVAFALGCSFTFEHAMIRADIPVWNVAADATVPMFRSSLPTVAAGPFSGRMVVSMRPIPGSQVGRAVEISGRFPLAHGAPVHWGDPAEIGIDDLARPDWGDAAPLGPGEIPVFWACGVTPQVALEAARLPLVITHTPGRMLVTDVAEDAETPVLPSPPRTGRTPT